MTHNDRMAKQRERRRANSNAYTKRYEKTEKGFLMRLYRNMKSRISGVQKTKYHLYFGKEIMSKENFYKWALASHDFRELFQRYRDSGFNRKLAPSVDRINSELGYTESNIEWVTMSENSRRGSISRHGKPSHSTQIVFP